MFNQVVAVLFYAVVAASLYFGMLNLVLSNIYDTRQSKLRRELSKHPYARRLRARPLISVVVYASNDSEFIGRCLDALFRSSYKKLEIIVVDNVSSDATTGIVRNFIKQHPKLAVRLVAKKKPSSRDAAIIQAANYARGDYNLIIDAYCEPRPEAIKSAMLNILSSDASIVTFNSQAEHDYSMTGLADSIRSILLNRVRKAGTLITPGFDAANHATLYKKAAYENIARIDTRALSNLNFLRKFAKRQLAYDSHALVRYHSHTPAKTTLTSSQNRLLAITHIIRNALSRLEPLLVIFMVYVALRFNNPGFLLMAWASFTLLFVLAVWSDENQRLAAKFRLTLLGIVAYSLYIARQLQVLLRPSFKFNSDRY